MSYTKQTQYETRGTVNKLSRGSPHNPHKLPVRIYVPDVSRVDIFECKKLIVLEYGVAAEPE